MKRLVFISFLSLFFLADVSFIIPPKTINSERHVNLKITYKINVSGHLNKMRLKMVIPENIKQRQEVDELTFSIEPDSFYTANGNSYVLFRFYDIDKDFKIVLKSKLTIYSVINTSADTAKADFFKFLVAEPNIEAESEKIISTAQTLKQRTDIETVMKTFDFVKEHITYKKKAAIGAEQVLESGIGKCMDYSDLFVALLRANNIPAKSMFGIVVSEHENPLHAWPEAYLRKQGWIRFDPTSGHSDIESDGKNFKMRISNKYVTLSEGRNDPELRASLYHYNYNCTKGSSVSIKTSFDIEGDE